MVRHAHLRGADAVTGSASDSCSVTGAATLPSDPGAPLILTVSANSGSGGWMRLTQGSDNLLSNVADVAVVGNVAYVVAQITQSTAPNLVGLYFYGIFRDKGPTGDGRPRLRDDPLTVPQRLRDGLRQG